MINHLEVISDYIQSRISELNNELFDSNLNPCDNNEKWNRFTHQHQRYGAYLELNELLKFIKK